MKERILVYGYFGGRNFGDELMLRGLIDQIGDPAEHEIRIVTPGGTVASDLSSHISRGYRTTISDLVAGLRWASVFVICGGTMFHDSFSWERHKAYRRNLVGLAGLCVTARLLGCKVWLTSVGMGPFTRRLTRSMARIALIAASKVTVRDLRSYNDVLGLGFSKDKARIVPDLAVRAISGYSRGQPSQPKSLLISVVPPTVVSTAPQSEASEFVEQLGRRIEEYLARHSGWSATVLVVAMGRDDHDREVSSHIASLLRDNARNNVKVLTFNGDPNEFLDLISRSSFVIAARYHIGLSAELIGVPTAWVAYQRKVADAAHELQVPPGRLFVPTPRDVDGILALLTSLDP